MQAALLLPRIGVLPVWGDEQFVLNVVQASIPHMLEMLRGDFHPPLYFLFLKLCTWLLPWPMPLIDQIRLTSVGFGLLATVAIDRLWLRDLPSRPRGCFLLLWALSPFLLLYARMGRSYTAQLLVAVFAVRYAVDWFRRPAIATALRFAVAECVLLYVHYLPGLSVGASFVAYGLYRMARGERERVKTFTLATAVCGAIYLPWATPLTMTIWRRVGFQVHELVPNAAIEHVIRLAYTYLSLTFGETLPLFGLVLAAALTTPILWMLVRGLPDNREWLPLILGALPIAYALTAKHVILSMTPSRLSFLLPFHLLLLVRGCERSPRAAAVVIPGLVATSLIATVSYHRQEDFLNRGYLIPFEAIATYASGPLSTDETLFVIDASNIDATPLLAALPPAVPALTAYDDASSREIRRRIDHGTLRRVWFLRNTHDVSKERWSTRMAAELARSFRLVRSSGYVPYGSTDRLAMRVLAWPERPTHLLELLEFERAGAGVPPFSTWSSEGLRPVSIARGSE